MYDYGRWLILIAIMAVTGIFAGITVGIAQTPTRENAEASALEEIRGVLDGKTPAGQTNDPILNDVLNVIRQQGSVLDGSSLDLPSGDAAESVESTDSQRALAAELLLRTSRTLEQIGPVDKTRQQLVKQMRGEAVRLLSQ